MFTDASILLKHIMQKQSTIYFPKAHCLSHKMEHIKKNNKAILSNFAYYCIIIF